MESKKKYILYVDMDDTVADFIGSEELFLVGTTPHNWPRGPLEMYNNGFFRNLKPIEGSIEAVRQFIKNEKLDVFILTKPVHDSPHSYSEKVEWIHEHLPELSNKIIMTQQKELCHGHFLIDDSLDWKIKWEASCDGLFVHFDPRKPRKDQWEAITALIDFMTHG